MAASANPSSGNQDGAHAVSSLQGGGGGGGAVAGNPSNANSTMVVAPDSSGAAQALKHNPGLSVQWSQMEQSILEEGLAKYASESTIARFAKIATQLHLKTVRDVALRCRWMAKKESGKRKKDDHSLTRKSKEKKGASDPSAKASPHLAARPNVPPYALPMPPMDNDDEISDNAIGGATGQLLEQNTALLNQISTNFTFYQIQENIILFCQTWDNIHNILNDMKEMPGIMNQMPPFPAKINEKLANSILPRSSSSSMPRYS